MAISGLSEIGRDNYGVFPLKGKVLNVKDASQKQILENMEITNLKKILESFSRAISYVWNRKEKKFYKILYETETRALS